MALKYRFIDHGRWAADSALNSWSMWCFGLLAVAGGLAAGANRLNAAAYSLKKLSAPSATAGSLHPAALASAAPKTPGDFTADLPATVPVDELIADIYKEAGADAVQVSSVISARQRESTAALAGKTAIQFKVSGPYLGVTQLLEHLLSIHPGMTVQKLSLARGSGNALAVSPGINGTLQSPSVDASVSLIQWTRPAR